MTKRQLIEQIQHLNGQVTGNFLHQFQAPELMQYLKHLKAARQSQEQIRRSPRHWTGAAMHLQRAG